MRVQRLIEVPIPEPILWDDWHAVAELETVRQWDQITTTLFGRDLTVTDAAPGVRVAYADGSKTLPASIKYGLVWTCLGTPQRDVIDFPESAEPDRYVISTGSFGIRVSGLRLVENFLDIAHFPYVHTGYLGVESSPQVLPYTVRVTDEDEILVTDCRFLQPKSSPVSTGSLDVGYLFHVLRPYTVLLKKTNAVEPDRSDTIVLFVQPVDEERCVGHTLVMSLHAGDPDEACRWFQRLIIGQDRRILENQRPRRLPLDLKSELPVRADLASITYRRWLLEHGVRYGAIAP